MTQRAASSSTPVWSATTLDGNPHDRADKSERVQAMFASIAGAYDRNNRIHSFGRDQAWRRKAAALAAVSPADDVLDVACGTGDLTEALADRGPASVTGVDFTEPMLEIARAKSGGRRRGSASTPPTFATADAMALPFDDASFDVVTIAFGIRNVADPARALTEFRRVLRPGGRLVVLEFAQPRQPLIRAVSNIYTQRIMPWTASLVARDRSGAYRYLPRSVATFAEGAAFLAMLEEAGFDAVSEHRMTFGICTAYRGVVENGAGEP